MSRNAVLGAALAATLLLVAMVAAKDEPPGDPVAAAVAVPRSTAFAASSARVRGGPVSPRESRAPWPEPAESTLRAWTPAAPPVAPPAPVLEAAAPPPPPAFPYQWIGTLQDDAERHALLANEQRSFGVRPGDVLDDSWRVEQIDDGTIRLTWLPTAQPVVLSAR